MVFLILLSGLPVPCHDGNLMTDFFISYTHADSAWAEWIAFELEDKGYSTVIQAWDFRPGSNFVLEMQRAAATAERTIQVLSPDYLQSKMAAAEWAAAFARDPEGLERRLIPVMVRTCEPKGLLPTIVQVRIMGLSEEAARAALLAGVHHTRAKPSERPIFPGSPANSTAPKAFPGPSAPNRSRSSVIPAVRRPWTDFERNKFLKEVVETIRQTFEQYLAQAKDEEPRLDGDLTLTAPFDFTAELYLDGTSKSRCRVWLSRDMGSDGIGFSEGRIDGNSYNEMLDPCDDEPLLRASMAAFYFHEVKDLDMDRLTADDAAKYLWHRFVKPLSY